uniref:Aminopeptidase P N-terminal domain-containing protein n=1 Tax=Clastoptera arizonana TaxID=38151 RepID=A0A1B6CRT2_9HEMI
MFYISRVTRNKSCDIKAWRKTCTTVAAKNDPEEGIYGKEKLVEPFGQPTPKTHPHLLKVGEVIPGLEMDEFAVRRQNLVNQILRTSTDSQHMVVIPSSQRMYMTEKIPYLFRQNTDFLYFTGCLEPDSALVITATNENNVENSLFLRKRDKHAELWDGPRTGVERATDLFGIENPLPITSLGQFISSFFEKNKQTMLWYDFVGHFNSDVHKVIRNCLDTSTRKSEHIITPVIQR